MADVDFSNAVLEPVSGQKPLTRPLMLGIARTPTLYDAQDTAIVTGQAFSTLENTSTKYSLLFSGTFTASGTEFYIVYSQNDKVWKVSNISFASGDIYSFVIDIETSGNV